MAPMGNSTILKGWLFSTCFTVLRKKNISGLTDLHLFNTDVCVHGALRLTPVPSLFPSDAASTSTGTLQVCVEGVWTSLCSEGLSNLEAAVACAQLGYSRFGEFEAERWSVHGTVKSPIKRDIPK